MGRNQRTDHRMSARSCPGSKILLSAALLVALTASGALAGCSSDGNNGTSGPPSSGGGQVNVGNTVNYGSFGTKATIDCADGKSLNVGGSNNTLTVTGSCWGVNVGGADNRITFEKITYELSVVGLNNTIAYKEGNPRVNNLGSGNTISNG